LHDQQVGDEFDLDLDGLQADEPFEFRENLLEVAGR